MDSAFLLAMAVKYKAQVQPYFIKTAFQPEFELHDARELTRRLGVELTVIEHDILSSRQVAETRRTDAITAKNTVWTFKGKALKDGYTMLLDGTNASDDSSDRPGMQAIRELEVRSPLRECGLTKQRYEGFPERKGFLPGTSLPMPAWQQEYLRALCLQNRSFKKSKRLKISCSALDLRIFASDFFMGQRVFSFRQSRWQK